MFLEKKPDKIKASFFFLIVACITFVICQKITTLYFLADAG